MPLFNAIGIRPGEIFACVGAGGKSTLCWRLWEEFHVPGRAVFTTTTHMLEPILPPDSALLLAASPDATRLRELLTKVAGVVLAGARLPDAVAPFEPNPAVPTRAIKLAGLAPDRIDRLTEALRDTTWIVEADGARGRGLKVPAAHEPVIPARSTCVAVVAHLDTIGHPLGDATAHRAGQVATYLGARLGDPITADHIARLMSDPRAGLKGIPGTARVVAVLSQRDEARLHPQAEYVAMRILAAGRYERVVAASLRAAQPVLKVFTS